MRKKQTEDLQPYPLKIVPIIQQKITMTYKSLVSIPPITFKNQIRHLHLSHNQIKSIKGIQGFPNLQSLNISYNKLINIDQLQLITNKTKLLRLGLRQNEFKYGYQKYAVQLFPNLQRLDDINLVQSQKLRIKQMSQHISKQYIKGYWNSMQILNFMNDMISKIRIHKQLLAKTQIKDNKIQKKYQSQEGFKLINLLYQNINQVDMTNLNNIYAKSHKNLDKLSFVKLLQIINQILNIFTESGFKCSCRPVNIRIANHDTFITIFDKILLHFANRYNYKLQNFLIQKITSNLELNQQEIINNPQYKRQCMIFQFYKLRPNQSRLHEPPGKYIQKINPLLLPLRRVPIQEDLANDQMVICGLPLKKTLSTKTKFTQLQKRLNIKQEYIFEKKKLQSVQLTSQIYNSPDYLKDQYLSQLPIFQYQKNYIQILGIILMEQVFKLINIYDQLCGYQHTLETRIRPSIGQRSTNNTNTLKQNINVQNFQQKKQEISLTKGNKKQVIQKGKIQCHDCEISSIQQQESLNIDYKTIQLQNKYRTEKMKQPNLKNVEYRTVQKQEYQQKSSPKNTIKRESTSKYRKITPRQIYNISLYFKSFSGLILNARGKINFNND